MTEYTHYSKKRDRTSRFFCLFKTLHIPPYLVAGRIFVLEEKRMTCLYNQVWRQRLAQVSISRIKRYILVVIRHTRLKLQPFRRFKHHALMANCVGVVDSGYRGEVHVMFRGLDCDYEVGDRIAQAVIMPIPSVEYVEAEELSDSERGANGIGSTGVR